MNLPDFDNDLIILNMRHSLGIPDGHYIKYGTIPKIQTSQQERIVSLSDSELKVHKATGLLYKELGEGKELFLLYIYTFDKYEPRFHFANCSTLVKQRQTNGIGKYVESQRMTGNFSVFHQGQKISDKKLNVCQNCLTHINFKNFAVLDRLERQQVVDTFDIEEFFRVYVTSLFIEHVTLAEFAKPNIYPPNWGQLSKQIRSRANWQCENCQIDLSRDTQYLDVHHIDRQKHNNDAHNLIVLCIACHAEQAGHEHIKHTGRYINFKEKFS